MSLVWQHMQNPVLYAVPVFLVFIAVEAVALNAGHGRGLTGYVRGETRTSMISGAVSLAFMFVFKLLTLVLFTVVWVEWAPWHLPTDKWWTWAVLLVAVDLTWYCNHRFSHRVRVGWAGHRAHHSSEGFNLGSALRLKWNPWSEAIFWLPLPLLGFAPWTIYVAYGFNMIYQFFLHTELVGRLPRPVEFVFNTPAHHRVHHSRHRVHLDSNYGGMLIVWDRLFGTFTADDGVFDYGVAGDSRESDRMLHLQYGEYARIVGDVRRSARVRDGLGYVFGPPGWTPADAPSPVGPGRGRPPMS